MYGSIFQVFFVIFLWTYGIMIFKKSAQKSALRKELLKAIRNPSLIAVYLGIAMVIFDLKLPQVISVSASSIGSMSGPLSMIIIGVVFYKIRIKDHLKDWTLYYGVALKLIIIPAILFLISLLIKDRSMVSNSVIILGSMPAAAMTSIFADSFDIEREYGAVVVVVTTLLSVLTIPLLLRVII